MSSVDFFILREAVASIALEHDSECACTICRANKGDLEAWALVCAAGVAR